VRTLVLLMGTGVIGMASYEALPWRGWMADYRTKTGERRRIQLADGGTLDINTGTAVDVRYGPELRLLQLHEGEILVRHGQEGAAGRPFEVHTPQGAIRALGTRFSVRAEDGRTRVAVFEDAVEVRPRQADGNVMRLQAGQQVTFTDATLEPVMPVEMTDAEWT